MKEITNYKKAFAAIAKKFVKKYFTDEWEEPANYFIIGEDLPIWWNTICISDEWYMGVDDMITCLELNIDSDMFFERYDSLDMETAERPINLYYMHKWKQS